MSALEKPFPPDYGRLLWTALYAKSVEILEKKDENYSHEI